MTDPRYREITDSDNLEYLESEKFVTKYVETLDDFIFQTIRPYCEETTQRLISKHDLENALIQYFKGGWISVKDRLPERDGKYLVVSKTASAEPPPYVKTAWFLNNLRDNFQFKYEGEPNEPGFYNGDGEGDWVERYVTHWMPLPEPPKEET